MSALAAALCLATAPPLPRRDVPVQIHCDQMVVENQQALARCEGHVKAVRDNVTVTCDRAVAAYDATGRITELTCRGRVHVVQRPATPQAHAKNADGDRGVYLERARTLTLTGHATLEQGEDRLAGEPIVFYVDEDRVVAKGAKLVGRVEDVAGPAPDGGRRE